ncbi:MAG: cysteine-rich KTR domain-containing protein [Oscillospiraceae bacterium]|nr:cysteine-rich KTR domain-containing protein [Oscillospiraceae bacterium]
MSDEHENGKWIPCPICEGKTRTKVYRNTVLLNFPLYCPRCKKETQINVIQMTMTLSNKPDA